MKYEDILIFALTFVGWGVVGYFFGMPKDYLGGSFGYLVPIAIFILLSISVGIGFLIRYHFG
jgi:hypothetical protein